MKKSITVIDDFCPEIDLVKQSSLQSGYGTWRPNKGDVGGTFYDGLNFVGRHDLILKSLFNAEQKPIFPAATFFRITTLETKTYVHSDRSHGDFSCITYLSSHDQLSGTAFYRHRATGLTEMPSIEELVKRPDFEQLKSDMNSMSDEIWEKTHFVPSKFNRALIFDAPLFHARISEVLETSYDSARMVHVVHYFK